MESRRLGHEQYTARCAVAASLAHSKPNVPRRSVFKFPIYKINLNWTKLHGEYSCRHDAWRTITYVVVNYEFLIKFSDVLDISCIMARGWVNRGWNDPRWKMCVCTKAGKLSLAAGPRLSRRASLGPHYGPGPAHSRWSMSNTVTGDLSLNYSYLQKRLFSGDLFKWELSVVVGQFFFSVKNVIAMGLGNRALS